MKLSPLLVGLMALYASAAFAQSSSTIVVKPASGANVNVAGQNDVSSNFHYRDVMEGLRGSTPVAVTIDSGDSGMWTHVVNWPGSWAVTGTFWPYTMNGDGGVPSHITNFPSSFGISGTLPAFAATPTFNLGTLGGAATAVNQTNVQSAPGTPQTTAVTIQGNASGIPVLVNCITGCGGSGSGGAVTMAASAVQPGAYLLGAIADLSTSGTIHSDIQAVNTSLGTSGTLHSDLLSLNSSVNQSIPAGTHNIGQTDSPCNNVQPFNITANTAIFQPTNKAHICSIVLLTATQQAVSVVEGTQTTNPCDTGVQALIGDTTAVLYNYNYNSGTPIITGGHGMQFSAGQGINITAGVPFMTTKVTHDQVCVFVSGLVTGNTQTNSNIVSGFFTYGDY